MASESQEHLTNGNASGGVSSSKNEMKQLDQELKDAIYEAEFHGDMLLGDAQQVVTGYWNDISGALATKNLRSIGSLATTYVTTWGGLNIQAGAEVIASLPENGPVRISQVKSQVTEKYNKMLHPPLTYLGDAFQYRTADGKFNNILVPHLGQAGAPYAKTVPSKTHLLGAQPDPGDIFDRLMARQPEGRPSGSGLSSMLIYHATIIIHDIFRTNNTDKNISDSSSYLDLSPLYGYTEAMQRKVRDDKYKLGLLKPDTFAEDRLLRQPPGVCIMLVMYNRYHNHAATQLRRINENGRFNVPLRYAETQLVAVAEQCIIQKGKDLQKYLDEYKETWESYRNSPSSDEPTRCYGTQSMLQYNLSSIVEDDSMKSKITGDTTGSALVDAAEQCITQFQEKGSTLQKYLTEFKAKWKTHRQDLSAAIPAEYAEAELQKKVDALATTDGLKKEMNEFRKQWTAAWDKLDDDLFQTARLITCGMYVNVSIHDYLRALMGFHQWNTTFTLDPRVPINDPTDSKKDHVPRGIGNQVTVEFNLLYRFHCAISAKDEKYTEDFMIENYKRILSPDKPWNPKNMSLDQFFKVLKASAYESEVKKPKREPWQQIFGLSQQDEFKFIRNDTTGLFDDERMVDQLLKAMDDPISNFGPRNVPRCLRSVEILGILQARKWEVGTLNDFRDFFNLPRHKTFADISKNVEIQNALRDLYDHPDKVELYPGAFCEGGADMGLDPGPKESNSALWSAIFSDAITLVRSDRFYTVDWNTNSLTSWGMKEVTPDSDVLKSSVFHRLIQRAFPEWFPYDSIHFFHPFYTTAQNTKYAKEQGYWPDFSTTIPTKPVKPIYLNKYEDVKAVLDGGPDAFVNPAAFDNGLPAKVKEILNPGETSKTKAQDVEGSKPWSDDGMVLGYFTALTREIIKREVIKVDTAKPTYQIDVTRDLAIPVITRFVADFLGFSHRLRTVKDDKRDFSENEIYQHITNCQVFLAYNADETKMLKRRVAFKSSMKFLFGLAENGNVKNADRSPLTKWAASLFGNKDESKPKNIKDVGMYVAQKILQSEKDPGRAAAILLLTALDAAYNSVLAFPAVLDHFMTGLDQCVDARRTDSNATCDWLEIQDLALSDDDDKIKRYVLQAQRLSVKLPVVRKVSHQTNVKIGDVEFHPGQTIVCDIFAASSDSSRFAKEKDFQQDEKDYLAYGSSLSEGLVHFNARKTAVLGLTAMIKVLAQTKNLRRGHDTQGRLKKISINKTSEGYANFMAPLRVEEIRRKAKDNGDQDLYNDEVLKPRTDTYLSAEWDEMIPFPTTWKVRFDGYGENTYDWQSMYMGRIPNDPLYQPQGPSHFGGSFADTVCVCSAAKDSCKCAQAQPTARAELLAEAPAEREPLLALGVQHGGCAMPSGPLSHA